MIIEQVRLRNIKSYDDTTIDFASGNNIIIGENGAGKSTILEGILYGLFGLFPGRTNANLVRRGKTNGQITIQFKSNGASYEVHRELNLSTSGSVSPSATLHQIGKPTLIAEKQSGVTTEIEDILGIDRDTFNNLILIKQGEIPEIAELPPHKRKKLFDKLLGLDVYEECWSNLGDVIAEHRFQSGQMEKERDTLQEIITELPAAKKQLKTFLDEQVELTNEYDSISTTLQSITEEKSQLDQLEKEITELSANKTTIAENLEEDENLVNQTLSDIQKRWEDPLPKEVTKLESLFNSVKAQFKTTQEDLTTARKQVKALQTLQTQLTGATEVLERTKHEYGEKEEQVGTLREELLDDASFLRKKPENEWQTLLQQRLAKARAVRKQHQKAHETLQQKMQTYKSTKDQLETAKKQHSKQKSELEKLIDRRTKQLGPNWMELATLDERVISENLKTATQSFNRMKKQKEKIERQYTKLETQFYSIKEDIQQAKKMEGVCPLCQQKVTEAHLTRVIAQLEEKQAKLSIEVEAASREREVIQKKYNLDEAELNKNRQTKESCSLAKQALEELQTIQSDEKQATKDIKRLQQKFKRLETLPQKVKKSGKELETHQKELESFQQLDKQLGQYLQAEQGLDDVGKRMTAHSQQVQELSVQFDEEQFKLAQEHEQTLDAKRDQLVFVRGHFRSLIKQVKRRNKNRNRLTKVSKQLEQASAKYDEDHHSKINSQHEGLTRQFGEINASLRKLSDEQIPQQTKLVDDLEKKDSKFQELNSQLERADGQRQILEQLRKFFRDIQPPLRRRHVSRVSSQATRLFIGLIDSGEYDNLRINENYDILVSRYGQEEEINNLSGGEQVLASLAIRLAFAQAQTTQDLLLLDEPTVHLDETRKRELISVFERTRPTRQLITVTHEPEFDSAADQVIRVSKIDGKSKIER